MDFYKIQIRSTKKYQDKNDYEESKSFILYLWLIIFCLDKNDSSTLEIYNQDYLKIEINYYSIPYFFVFKLEWEFPK